MPAERQLDTGEVQNLVIAGWTGRNLEALEHHIRELEAIGVKRPKSTPIFYRAAADLLTTRPRVQVLGAHSSGEAEYVIYALADGLWVGVGSDHTDRKAETIGVSLSKQMCAKPVGARLWRYDEVKPHWDELRLRSYIRIDGARTLYQDGPVATMRTPNELMQLYAGGPLAPGTAMFCGTLAVRGGVRPAPRFEMEIEDPVLRRTLSHAYDIDELPDEG